MSRRARVRSQMNLKLQKHSSSQPLLEVGSPSSPNVHLLLIDTNIGKILLQYFFDIPNLRNFFTANIWTFLMQINTWRLE